MVVEVVPTPINNLLHLLHIFTCIYLMPNILCMVTLTSLIWPSKPTPPSKPYFIHRKVYSNNTVACYSLSFTLILVSSNVVSEFLALNYPNKQWSFLLLFFQCLLCPVLICTLDNGSINLSLFHFFWGHNSKNYYATFILGTSISSIFLISFFFLPHSMGVYLI